MRMRTWIALVLATMLVAVGCRPAGLSLPASTIVSAGHATAGASIGAGGDPDDYGRLGVVIRWPRRDDPAFRAQVIPQSANSLVFTLTNASGSLVIPQQTVVRPQGAATQSVSFQLHAQNNLTLDVKAYRESAPIVGTNTVIAEGVASGFNVIKSKDTNLAIPLVPTTLPAVTGISPNPAAPGTTVTITGQNLVSAVAATPSVTFDGATASSVVASGSSLVVVVPQNATVGNVVVTTDGVPSASQNTFWACGSLAIAATTRQSWDNGPADATMVYYGYPLQFAATPAWLLAPGTNVNQYGQPPAASWNSSNVLVGGGNAISATGLLTASTTHATSSVTASLGSLTSNAITADPVGVDSVVLNAPIVNGAYAATINGVPVAQAPAADYPAASTSFTVQAVVNSTLPFNSGVGWSQSRIDLTSSVTTNTSALIQPIAGSPAGTESVTAYAIDSPNHSVFATLGVTVTLFGSFMLEVD